VKGEGIATVILEGRGVLEVLSLLDLKLTAGRAELGGILSRAGSSGTWVLDIVMIVPAKDWVVGTGSCVVGPEVDRNRLELRA